MLHPDRGHERHRVTSFNCAVVLACLSLVGCAGVGSNYSTPAPKQQIPFKVVAITPDVARDSQRSAPRSDQVNSPAPPNAEYAYQIGPGDILSIYIDGLNPAGDVRGNQGTEAETQYIVSETGEIYLPLHGALTVGGLTIGEVYQRVIAALSRFINAPQVNVRIAEFRSQRITVAGAVGAPGFVPVTDQPLSIAQLMVLAGVTDRADLRKVVLKRQGEQRVLDVAALMESPDFGGQWVR